jgi:hypothetical protein
MELSKDEALKKLKEAQDLLSDIYHWACEYNKSDIESVMSVADGCIIDAYNFFDKIKED